MADFTFPTYHSTGLATVETGSATVTGTDTFWSAAEPALSPLRPGDLFGTHVGRAVRILEVVSDTELLLAHPWPGDDQTDAPYEIQLTPRIVGAQEATRRLLEKLSNGNLESLADLEGIANWLPMFSGAGTMTLVSKNELTNGVNFDVMVNNLAARATYNGEAAGFSVLVANVGDGRSAVYAKRSATSGDWTDAAYVTGPVGPEGDVGPQGIQWRGSYSGATAYAVNDVVRDNGSSWIAIQATTGNAPPVLPTLSNTWWTLFAGKGVDGTGTGDVVGPASAADGQLAVYNGTTGKLLKALSLLGTVSQSGGAPTGAPMERGANANGKYELFANGLAICTMTNAGTPPNSAAGALFVGSVLSATLPVALLNPVSCAISSGEANTWWNDDGASALTGTRTSISLRPFRAASIGSNVAYSITVIGRWF